MALTLNPALVPGQLVRLAGAVETRTVWLTVRLALLVTAVPQIPLAWQARFAGQSDTRLQPQLPSGLQTGPFKDVAQLVAVQRQALVASQTGWALGQAPTQVRGPSAALQQLV